jgi:site-specific DNA-methyltransferase (adenine-specific)
MSDLTPFINQIIEGDCLEVMENIPDGSVDFILCDLPYGITANPWDQIINMQRLWQHYERIIKVNGAIALSGQGIFTAHLILSNPTLFRYKMVWIKSKAPNFLSVNKQPLRKHEDICIFYKKQPVYHPQMWLDKAYDRGIRKTNRSGNYGDFKAAHCKSDGQRFPYDVLFFEDEPDDWCYFKTAETEGKAWHPTQKPIDLGRYLIRTFTDPGDIVLDNACGSGSFPVAAIRENRRFIGIEKNKGAFNLKTKPVDFVKISRERLKQELATKNYSFNPINHLNQNIL